MLDNMALNAIVDMAGIAARTRGGEFTAEYEFSNGTKMVVSRNFMVPGGKHGYMGVLPYDASGKQIDERADNWLTVTDVAQKMQILASE